MKPVMNNMSVVVSRVLQSGVRYFNPYAVVSRQQSAPDDERSTDASVVHRPADLALIYDSRQLRARGHKPTRARRGAWWKNLTSGTARVRLQGTWHVVTPEVIREPVALSAVLGRMLAINPAIAVFTGIRPGSDGRPFAESLERERLRGFVVVRLHLRAEV